MEEKESIDINKNENKSIARRESASPNWKRIRKEINLPAESK